MKPIPKPARRGITLVEVLIAIGILAIGLTSVMSLIPAGKSEATKAVILDRTSNLALNALADSITYGITRPASVEITGSANVYILDPDGVVYPNAGSASLRSLGILSDGKDSAGSAAVGRLITQSRDDLVYNPPATDDDLPTNAVLNKVRAFAGRTSCLISVSRIDGSSTNALSAGDQARLTAVVFHNRDLSTPTVTGTFYEGGGYLEVVPPTDRTIRTTVRPGTVIYDSKKTAATFQSQRWNQVVMASVDDTTSPPRVYVTFSGVPPLEGAVAVLLDSVGLAEQTVTLEGPGPYAQ
jgi:prepilin-type N-terminal cleavage/methylation domain-containing protein